MSSDMVSAHATQVSLLVADLTGIPLDGIDDIVIVYSTAGEEMGVLSYAGCKCQTAQLLTLGTLRVLQRDTPGDPPNDHD